jgi:RNA polymerase sigma-70 factor (ECF subfamily)
VRRAADVETVKRDEALFPNAVQPRPFPQFQHPYGCDGASFLRPVKVRTNYESKIFQHASRPALVNWSLRLTHTMEGVVTDLNNSMFVFSIRTVVVNDGTKCPSCSSPAGGGGRRTRGTRVQHAAAWSEDVIGDSEASLIEDAKRDKSRFAELYERHVDAVYSYLVAKTESPDDAADLTQQVFLQAMRALPRYRASRTPFRGWLFRIARNTAINFNKRRRTETSLEILPARLEPAVNTSPTAQVELRETLRRLLSGLDESSRELLVLRFGADLSVAEVAAATGKSEAATRMQIMRIMRSIKEKPSDRS